MGNTRSEGSWGDGGGGCSSGSSMARVNAGPSTSSGARTRSSGSPAVSAAATRSNTNGSVMDAPCTLSRGGPGVLGLRRSSRNAPAPSQESQRFTRVANAMTPLRGVSNIVENSDSNSLSKKRKRMDSGTYIKQFKLFIRASVTDVVVATPDRVGKENTPGRYVAEADITTVIPCEGARLLQTLDKGVGKCTSPFSEVQPHKPTDTYPQNRAAENSLAVEARDQPTSPARQADSSILLEHWVPAYISQLQLVNYCSILLSSSAALQSQKETDSARALCDILMSLSKCCDHPYLINEILQKPLVNNHDQTESIDIRVHACGKLVLLDKMLKETWDKRLRVIILFQSSGAGGNPLGDILEGVVHHRFGRESYERVECGALRSRKQMAVNMFNDKTKGRFVFLIDNYACIPSIELSSVDALIIYNSDWNPLNDLKALQRIKIESQFKYPSIFRLYSPFTIEEKKLVLAKQGMPIDNIQDITYSSSHSLISWGASFLFTRLDELKQDNYSSKSCEEDSHFMDKIISEFLTKLPTCVEDVTEINSASISKANTSGEFYSRSITLIGEKEGMPALDGDPSKFWLNLLDGRSPCWSYISEPPQSSHRTLQNMEEPAKVPAEEANEARRKHRKFGEILGPSSKSHDDTFPENCTTSSHALQPLDYAQPKLGVKKLIGTPKILHERLNQELSKLLKVLQLPDNVNFMAEQFFEYVLKKHIVVLEPVFMLHALNIALCWHAASLLNYKVDRKGLLALAEKCVNYECDEELVALFYGKLRILKKKFPHRAGATSNKCQLTSVEDTQFSCQETSTDLRNDHMFQKQELDLHGNFTNGTQQEGSCAEQMFAEGQELTSVQETHRECHLSTDELNITVEKRIDLVNSVFSLREKSILDKQQLEISDLETHAHNKVIRLKEVCNLVLEHIRRSCIDEMARNDKIKLTIQWFTMLIYAFLEHMRLQHNKLEALQSRTWSEERQLKENLNQEAKTGQLDRSFDQHIALQDSNFVIEDFIHFKEQNDEYHIVESSVSDCQQPSNEGLLMEITLVQNVVPAEPISTQPVQNELVEVLVDLGGGPTSEALHIPENNIRSSSDGIGSQNVGCSSSTIPAKDHSIGQESSSDDLLTTSAQQSAADLQLEVQPSTQMQDRHPSAEAELTGILDTEAAGDFQSELQPSTSMQDQAERASLLGTITTRHLQPEMQPSTSTQDVPIEKTYLRTIPVLESQTNHHSVEPSCDPHARVESAGTSCTVTAHDLLSEIQASASMHDELAEAERPGMLGTTVAEDLQSEMQSSATVEHALLERTHSEERNQISFQPDMTPGPEQPTQLLPPTIFVFNHPTVSVEPLENELYMLKCYNDFVSKAHEQKRSLLEIECNQEMEKVIMKYESLLQKENSTYIRRKEAVADICRKVFLHQSLAENFLERFTRFSAAQVGSTTPLIGQPLQSSSAQAAGSPVASSSARPPVFNLFHSPEPCIPPSLLAQPSSSWAVQPQSILDGNLYGATSSPFILAPVPHGSCGFAGAQTTDLQPQSTFPGNLYGATLPPFVPTPRPCGSYRSARAQSRPPAPHLQQLRTRSPYAIETNQQQLPVGPQAWRQFLVPGVIGNIASMTPRAGDRLTSMAPSSSHQTIASASSPHPGLRSSSLPPPEPMANFVQSSSSNHIFMAGQQSSTPNMIFRSAVPLNAAPGSWHAGAQIAGARQSGHQSTPMNVRLPGGLGLSSDPPGAAGATPEVVCLSDNECTSPSIRIDPRPLGP